MHIPKLVPSWRQNI